MSVLQEFAKTFSDFSGLTVLQEFAEGPFRRFGALQEFADSPFKGFSVLQEFTKSPFRSFRVLQEFAKMVHKVEVEGFDAFVEQVEKFKSSGKDIFVLFSGSKDPNSGKSWCSDCVVAEPVVKGALDKAPEDAVFIYVSVGGRDFWRDRNNVFRADFRTKLKSVPTLMKFGGPQRLEEEQCTKADMVEMLFEDA